MSDLNELTKGQLITEVIGTWERIAQLEAENAALREALEIYADKEHWGSEAVTTYEYGFPDVNGNPSEREEVRINLGIDVVWSYLYEHGYVVAQAALAATGKNS